MRTQQLINDLTKRITRLEQSIAKEDSSLMRRELRVHYSSLLSRRTRLLTELEMNS